MSIAASIVAYHTPADELRCALEVLSASRVVRITVVDHSGDESLRALVERFAKAEYQPHPNRGYGAGHNVALRRSLAEGMAQHLVINSDVAIASDDIDRMVCYMDAHPDVGALHPRMFNSDGSPQYTVRLCPTPADLIIRRFMPGFVMAKRRRLYELRHLPTDRPVDVPYMQGSFMLLNCRVLEQTGLFDERFFLYPEDIDLSRRLHRVSRTLYFPEVAAVHRHGAASYHSLRMLAVHCVNMVRYFNKWGWVFDRERKRFNAPFLLREEESIDNN